MSNMIKRIKRYLIILLITSTGLFAGYSYVEDILLDYFSSSVENTIKDAVVDKVKDDVEEQMKNKLFDLLKEVVQ